MKSEILLEKPTSKGSRYVALPINTDNSKEVVLKDLLVYLDTLKDISEIDKRLLYGVVYCGRKGCYPKIHKTIMPYVWNNYEYKTLPEIKAYISRLLEQEIAKNKESKDWFIAEEQKFLNRKIEKKAEIEQMNKDQDDFLKRTTFISCKRCLKPTPENDEVKNGIRFCLSCETERGNLMQHTRKIFDRKILDSFYLKDLKNWVAGKTYAIKTDDFFYEFLLDRTEYPSVNAIMNVLKQYEPTLKFSIPDAEHLWISIQ